MYSMTRSVTRLLVILFASLSLFHAGAQPFKSESKPYKVLTSGRQLTVKSSRNIINLMVWSSDGHRVVEQREINDTQVKFEVPVNRNVFYLRIELPGGKIYTEKVGVQ